MGRGMSVGSPTSRWQILLVLLRLQQLSTLAYAPVQSRS
jgi:hypothetical protein